jgi:hypothetical protein
VRALSHRERVAEGRVRAGTQKRFGPPALILRFAPPSPVGRRTNVRDI